MPSNLNIPLPQWAIEALIELAQREWRPVKAQATLLLVTALRQAGYSPEPLNDSAGRAERRAATLTEEAAPHAVPE